MSLTLRARVATAMLELAFNPHQRRDSKGRWTKMPDSELKRPRSGSEKAATAKKAALKKALSDGVTDGDPRELEGASFTAIADLFEMTDPVTGMQVEIGTPRSMPGGLIGSNKLWVPFTVFAKDDEQVGYGSRYITRNDDGELEVEHALFNLTPEVQGGGFSSRWLAEMEDRYRAAGIKRINISTAGVGGYAWAKAGFDFAKEAEARVMADRLSMEAEFGPDATPELLAMATDLMRRVEAGGDQRPTPMEIAMAGWTPGATTWPGKRVLMGQNWTGVKEL